MLYPKLIENIDVQSTNLVEITHDVIKVHQRTLDHIFLMLDCPDKKASSFYKFMDELYAINKDPCIKKFKGLFKICHDYVIELKGLLTIFSKYNINFPLPTEFNKRYFNRLSIMMEDNIKLEKFVRTLMC